MFFSDDTYAGTASEFLAMRQEPQSDDAEPTTDDSQDLSPTDDFVEPQDADDSATATSADDAEEDDDFLSVADRVAAVFGLDAAESPEAVAEPGDGETDGDGVDVRALPEEELYRLAEEALAAQQAAAEQDLTQEEQELNAEIAELEQTTRSAVQEQFQAQVINRGDEHYLGLMVDDVLKLEDEAKQQTAVDEETYIAQRLKGVLRPYIRAQREWVAKQKREVWDPYEFDAVVAAKKQNPKLRKLFAEMLITQRPDGTPRPVPLPKRAVEELLKIQNTDDMPTFAETLAGALTTRAREKQVESQQRKSEAARAVSRETITTPATGKPRSRKPAELQGSAEEFLEMNRRSGSAFARVGASRT